jgi:hydroxymethylpyrimidine kinase/phosphomethylpyrimidine kinase
MTPRVVLTIAGSDSSGGAGLQADLRTFAAHGLHGATAITAVTAQNTVAVRGVLAIPPQFVLAQVDAVLEDLTVVAVKTGMLASPDTVTALGALASSGALPNLVVDPVLVSSTGHPLMDEGGVAAFREHLLPYAAVATPNLREAAVLTRRPLAELDTVEAMVAAAEELRALGAATVVVKGGHLAAAIAASRAEGDGAARPDHPTRVATADGPGSPDVIAGPHGTAVLEGERINTANDHGTGCSLSAAIAARLGAGDDPMTAIRSAKRFVAAALRGGSQWQLGAGHGPIDHFGWERLGTEGGDRRPLTPS